MARRSTQQEAEQNKQEQVSESQDYRYSQQVNFWTRDSYGLLPKVEYPFKEDEPYKIDWKKLIPIHFIVPNKDKFPKDTNFSSLDVSSLKDTQQLILLAGFRYLASIRGYNYIKQNIKFANDSFVAAECEIEFIPNYETGMRKIIFTGEGDAHLGNTNAFSRNYLTCIAANRAFVRAVRNALDIPVLGQDELNINGGNQSESSDIDSEVNPVGPHAALISKLASKGKTLDQLKSKLLKDGFEEEIVKTWEKATDIPVQYVIKILGILSR